MSMLTPREWVIYRKAAAERAAQRAVEEEQAARERQQSQAYNASLKQQREERLEKERAEQRERAIEARLADVKMRLMHEWLADHPDQVAADFEKKAWPHLRANLVDELRQADIAATKAKLLASGNYGL